MTLPHVRKYFLFANILLLVIINNMAYGQTNVNIARKNYLIPSFSSTELSKPEEFMLEDSLLQANHYIKPITSSTFDFELRCKFYENAPFNRFYLFIIQGNKRKIKARYFLLQRVGVVVGNGPKIIGERFEIVITDEVIKTAPGDSVFRQLLDNHLFDIKGDHINYPQGVNPDKLSMSQAKIVFSLKLKDQYRSFILSNQNPKRAMRIKIVGDGKNLVRTIFNIFGKEKQLAD